MNKKEQWKIIRTKNCYIRAIRLEQTRLMNYILGIFSRQKSRKIENMEDKWNEKNKKGVFAVVLSLTLIAPYSNGINANVREKTINVNRSVFGDNLRASKKGEVCKKVKVDDGIKKTVKDTFVDKSKAGEEHIREENVEIDLEEVSKSEKIAKKIKNSFGVEAVYASDTTTQTKNRSDSTGTANIKLVVKYVISTYSGDEYARITKVTGKVTACNGSKVRFGSGVSMVSNKFVVAQWGKTKKAGNKKL